MRHSGFLGSALVSLCSLALSPPVLALQAGINIEVHQDIQCVQGPNGNCPNDFHLEGIICSKGGPPILVDHVDDLFSPPNGNFSYSITYLGTPDPCYYTFVADWWLTGPMALQGIPYCRVLHLGLLFDVDAANLMLDLKGWWTRDGRRVGEIIPLGNGGFVPMLGFVVDDDGGLTGQTIRIANGNVIQPPTTEPPRIPVSVVQMDVLAFPPTAPPSFRDLTAEGGQQSYPWVPVANELGPISPVNPMYMMPDSFFDVFLEMPQPGKPHPMLPVPIEPGGFLVSRQLIQFTNNDGQLEQRWDWEIHGAQPAEACCFNDGSCADLPPFDCLRAGGTPKGLGSTCATTICLPQGACCYGTAAPACMVTDPMTCQQQLGGAWKGIGTDCSDLDGDLVADICEPPVLEACCLPSGGCGMMTADACRQQLGQPMGTGSRCLGDVDGNGLDDLCEAKWVQLPDLAPTGIDISASEPLVLADDWQCKQRSLVTQIRIWGSWRYDQLPGAPGDVEFTLSIHRDVPAGPQVYSHPGEVLWVRQFPPYSFQVTPYQGEINEGWWDPREPTGYIFPGDHTCWEYVFNIPASEAFCQEGSSAEPMVYWLDLQARPVGPSLQTQFGWKTSTTHWNDDAVWGVGIEPMMGPWSELRYPPGHELYPNSIDLAFTLSGDQPCIDRDWGDAPDPSYPTLRASQGANHIIVPGMFLGNQIDAENDGQPEAAAKGDDLANVDDEDGVTFAGRLARNRMAKVTVIASVAGMLDAWIDFGADASWAQAGDQIFASMPLAAGNNVLTFAVPPAAVLGQTFARFRFSSAGGLSYAGSANDGEVEDYAVTIEPALVVARRVFYNNSYYDGNRVAIDPAPIAGSNNDDADAIDTSKQALRPGDGRSSFINWTGYDKGINGLIYEILAPLHAATVADFVFVNQGKQGTGATIVTTATVYVQTGLGTGGSDRVIITFPDGSLRECWLQVTVKQSLGLAADDVSYWGNAPGDGGVGNTDPNIIVGSTDEIAARNNPHGSFNRAQVWDEYDYNKTSIVDATDQIFARNNARTSFNCVKFITR